MQGVSEQEVRTLQERWFANARNKEHSFGWRVGELKNLKKLTE